MSTITASYWLESNEWLNSEELEKIAELTTNLKLVKDYLKSKGTYVSVCLAAQEFNAKYSMQFSHEYDNCLQITLETIIDRCGVPNFISGNYEVADKVLAKHGKKTKRQLRGLLSGKCVVKV
jgi:hypothetical protein